jgi:hypothetical protein
MNLAHTMQGAKQDRGVPKALSSQSAGCSAPQPANVNSPQPRQATLDTGA